MQELEILLIGFALGSIPTAELAKLMLAFLGKRLGISPEQITQYQSATTEDSKN